MSKHTPGPLQLIRVNECFAVADKDGLSILSIEWEDDTPFAVFYSEHDARLCAAQTELVEALEGIVGLWVSTCKSNGHQFDVYSEYLAAMEVLKKAKGAQP